MAAQLALKPLVLLAQILNAGQISPIIIRGDEQLLLLDPALLVGNVAEELLQRVALVEEALAVSGQVLDGCRVGKNPGKKKTSPVGFLDFCVFFFRVLFVFFVFFYTFAQKREILGFFQFQEYF